jgi:hypothetical protein
MNAAFRAAYHVHNACIMQNDANRYREYAAILATRSGLPAPEIVVEPKPKKLAFI